MSLRASSSGTTPTTPKLQSNETPIERDLSYVPCHERQRDHSETGDDAEGNNPDVPDRVAERTDESNSDNQVGKCEPVRSVRDEGVSHVCFPETTHDSGDPMPEPNVAVRRR